MSGGSASPPDFGKVILSKVLSHVVADVKHLSKVFSFESIR